MSPGRSIKLPRKISKIKESVFPNGQKVFFPKGNKDLIQDTVFNFNPSYWTQMFKHQIKPLNQEILPPRTGLVVRWCVWSTVETFGYRKHCFHTQSQTGATVANSKTFIKAHYDNQAVLAPGLSPLGTLGECSVRGTKCQKTWKR